MCIPPARIGAVTGEGVERAKARGDSGGGGGGGSGGGSREQSRIDLQLFMEGRQDLG